MRASAAVLVLSFITCGSPQQSRCRSSKHPRRQPNHVSTPPRLPNSPPRPPCSSTLGLVAPESCPSNYPNSRPVPPQTDTGSTHPWLDVSALLPHSTQHYRSGSEGAIEPRDKARYVFRPSPSDRVLGDVGRSAMVCEVRTAKAWEIGAKWRP